MDDYLPPTTGGKRPRSPVEKLADLAQGDEGDWRSSKRYLTSVIASGFSKLSFGFGGLAGCSLEQLAAAGGLVLSPTGSAQLGALGSPRGGGGEDVDMEESPPPQWPPSPAAHGSQASPVGGASGEPGGSQGNCGARAVRTRSLTPDTLGVLCGSQQPLGSPPVHAAGAGGGPASPSPVQFPFGLGSCGAEAAQQQAPWQLPAPAPPGSQQHAAAAAGPAMSPLPPKVLRATERPPNSPSDLPSSSLRKVALLRSLLARAEQHLQHQASSEQQPAQQEPQEQDQQQGLSQPGPGQACSCQPHAAGFGELRGGCGPQPPQQQQQPGGQQQQAAAHAALHQQRPQPLQLLLAGTSSAGTSSTPRSVSAGGMDCSGAGAGSPACRPSAALTAQQHPQAAAAKPQAQAQASVLRYSQAQQAFCGPPAWLQPPGLGEAPGFAAYPPVFPPQQLQRQQQQQQQQHQHRCQQQHPPVFGPRSPPRPGAGSAAQDEQRPREFSRAALEQLRAKALASSSRLELDAEDLASLQLSIQGRRGSADHTYTPSSLQAGSSGAGGVGVRRHSSHL